MNVLFCTSSYYPAVTGGAERQARLQARELVRRGHRVTVVCPEDAGLRSQAVDGVPIVRLYRIDRWPFTRISYFVHLFWWLWRHVREFDLVHVHLANIQGDLAVLVGRRWRRPTYLKVACGGIVGEVHRLRAVALLTRWYGFRHADRIQALSSEITQELRSIGVRADRIVEISNGIDLDEFSPVDRSRRMELRAALDLPQEAVVAVFVGRLVAYKGIDDLLGAWQSDVGEAQLVIVGATNEHLSIPPGVIVREWVNSARDYMRAADLFVHPSYADGMSNALLEAMACGLPLVATEHGGTRGFIEHEREALLVPARDASALAAAVARLTADSELRSALGGASRASAERYGIPPVVDQIEREYRALLVHGPPGKGSRGLPSHVDLRKGRRRGRTEAF
jgi:glycosyltransferase involved in cell wall biosynthesis